MARHLFDALARRYPMPARAEVELSGWRRRPRRRHRFSCVAGPVPPGFYRSWLTFALQSWNCRRRLAEIGRAVPPRRAGVDAVRDDVRSVNPFTSTTRRGLPRKCGRSGGSGARSLQHVVSRDDLERRVYRRAEHVFTMGCPGRAVGRRRLRRPGRASHCRRLRVNFDRLPEPRQHAGDPIVLFVGRKFHRQSGDRLRRSVRFDRACRRLALRSLARQKHRRGRVARLSARSTTGSGWRSSTRTHASSVFRLGSSPTVWSSSRRWLTACHASLPPSERCPRWLKTAGRGTSSRRTTAAPLRISCFAASRSPSTQRLGTAGRQRVERHYDMGPSRRGESRTSSTRFRRNQRGRAAR
jgi:hypothetical protein